MKKVNKIFLIFIIGCCQIACSQKHYAPVSMEGSRVEMNNTWDAKADPQMVALVNSYKIQLESQMNVEIGTAVQTMEKSFPQGLLSNFTADAMKEYAVEKLGGADFAVVNNGGLRATLNKGAITIGNMFEIYPFENRVVVLELQGSAVKELFDYLAIIGGEGLSGDVQLVINKKLVRSLKIAGISLDENKTYRVATLDYLAEGNSGMVAFKKAIRTIDSETTIRDVMIGHVKKCTAENKPINAQLDNRITVE